MGPGFGKVSDFCFCRGRKGWLKRFLQSSKGEMVCPCRTKTRALIFFGCVWVERTDRTEGGVAESEEEKGVKHESDALCG